MNQSIKQTNNQSIQSISQFSRDLHCNSHFEVHSSVLYTVRYVSDCWIRNVFSRWQKFRDGDNWSWTDKVFHTMETACNRKRVSADGC